MARRTLMCSLMLLLSWGMGALGQSGKGALSGIAMDASGAVLQGAEIDFEPKLTPVSTNTVGEFLLSDVPAGIYAVTVSYVGFTPYAGSVTVVAGQTARIQARLKVASSNEQVVVYSERLHGEAEAINRVRVADNILNVLPAEVIKSLPNANVADAIGRLPSVTLERDEGEGKYVQIRGTEPRLTNVTIDGINVASPEAGVRQIKLDILPSDLMESVEINKTLQANMPGDGIGGSVNLRTKSAGEAPTMAFESTGGYTPIIGGRAAFQEDGTLGKRFGPNQKLGILFGGTWDYNGRGINDIEPSPAILGAMDIRDYRYYRERLGFGGSADYRFTENSDVYVHGLYSHFDNFGDRWVFSPKITDLKTEMGTITSNSQIRRPVQEILSAVGGGHHVFSNSWAEWDVTVSRGTSKDKGYSSADFGPSDPANPLNNIEYSLDLSHPYRPQFNVTNGVNIHDASNYFLQDYDKSFTYSPQVDLGFGGGYGRNYILGSHFGSIEIGGRFRNSHKFQNFDDRVFLPSATNPEDPSLAMSNFLGTFSDPHYYDKSYTVGPFVDYKKVLAFPNVVTDPALSLANSLPNNFDLIEKVSAGYFMNTLDFGRYRLIAGLRIEGTQEDNLAYETNTTTPDIVKVKGSGSYVSVLPSIALRVNLTKDAGLRLVYGRGLARPNYEDLVPFVNRDDTAHQVSVGNPRLKPEFADNLDVLYEQYFTPLGLLQGGFFYKRLSDPIVPIKSAFLPTDPGFSPMYAGYKKLQSVNGGSAYVYGFEIGFQQHMTYLPGPLGGLGFSGNYGYTASQLTFPSDAVPVRSDKPALVRQAPNTWNLSPTYDKGRTSIRLGLSYNAANIFSYQYNDSLAGPLNPDGSGGGIKGPNSDTYLYAHLQVDVQGSFRLAKGFSLLAYGLNLNNEVFGFYNGSTIYPIQREYYQPTYGVGVRWTPMRER